MIQKFTMLLICATTLVASTKNTETIITPLPESPFETGHLPNGIAYSPNGKWLIVPCESDTFIYVYSVGSNGALQLIQKVPCLQSTGTAAYSPDGKYVSLTNLGRHIITTFSVALDGIITQVGSPINTNIFRPASIVYAPNGTFLAVQTEDYRNNIELFIVNQNGSLTSAQIFTKNGSDTISPRSLQFSPDSKYLAYSGSSGTVYVLTIDQQTGQVSNQRGFVAQGLASICSVAYSLNGNFLAAADNNNNNIALFTVHKIDGGLTLKETVAVIGKKAVKIQLPFRLTTNFLLMHMLKINKYSSIL